MADNPNTVKPTAGKKATPIKRRELVSATSEYSSLNFEDEIVASTPKRRVRRIGGVQTYVADPSAFGRLNVIDQIGVIKHGVNANFLESLAKQMGVPKDRLTAYLGIPRSTVGRKAKAQALLSSEQSERVLGVVRLVNQAKEMVEQSGVTDFNAAQWVSQWLEEPIPALDGRTPGEFMDTNLGQELVSNLLARMQSGAYS